MSNSPLNLFSLRGMLYLPCFVLGVSRGLLILLLALVFKGPRWFFSRKTRTRRPSCMEDPELGTHKYIKIKDLTFHAVVSGDPQNPLMLFLHGFPECWYSWRHQIREFNKDYHCVAFDMRGAGESDAPLEKESYTLDQVTGDVHELIKALGHSSCTLVGHDLGGIICWDFASRYPEMVDTFLAINAPNPNRFGEMMANYYLPQLWLSWYVFFFQIPWLPELLLSMGDYNVIKKQCLKGPATEEDIEAFKYSLSRPGQVKALLNYYRRTAFDFIAGSGVVDVPTLFVWGTAHHALHIKMAQGIKKFCPNITMKLMEGSGLIMNQEQPQLVNQCMRKYIEG